MSILTVNLTEKTVAIDGENVIVTGTEYRIIKLLAVNNGATITNDQIARIVFGTRPGERAVALPRWHIVHIRKKGINIVTRRGFGYYLEYDEIHLEGTDPLKLMINEFGGSLSPSIERVKIALENTLDEVNQVLELVRAHEQPYKLVEARERSKDT